MNFQGKIIAKTPEVNIWKNDTPKVSIVVEEIKDKYPESVLIDRMGDERVALVKYIEIGSEVSVIFNPRVTEYNDRHYQNNGGRKIEVLSEPAAAEDLPF